MTKLSRLVRAGLFVYMPIVSLLLVSAFSIAPEARFGASLRPVATYNALDINQGFDRCGAPSVAQMQGFEASLHEWEIGFYLPGSGHAQECSTGYSASWVSQILAQGWDIVPIWDDMQAPPAARSPMM